MNFIRGLVFINIWLIMATMLYNSGFDVGSNQWCGYLFGVVVMGMVLTEIVKGIL